MKMTNRFIFGVVLGLFLITGTYNAIVINSSSVISGSEFTFVKRLDEVYGITVPGREVATALTWKKLNTLKVNKLPEVVQPLSTSLAAPDQAESSVQDTVAAVQEELNLSLVEVINPKKWQNGLATTQFNGSLSTNAGVIESLTVTLPQGEGLSVSFSEMTGNVFEYDINGDLFTGMMYQVDQNAYMVTLTNGPLEGTRLRFAGTASIDEQQANQEMLANNNIEVGSFGDQAPSEQGSPESLLDQDQRMQVEANEAQGFNMSSAQTM
jgi:hypothetical protein